MRLVETQTGTLRALRLAVVAGEVVYADLVGKSSDYLGWASSLCNVDSERIYPQRLKRVAHLKLPFGYERRIYLPQRANRSLRFARNAKERRAHLLAWLERDCVLPFPTESEEAVTILENMIMEEDFPIRIANADSRSKFIVENGYLFDTKKADHMMWEAAEKSDPSKLEELEELFLAVIRKAGIVGATRLLKKVIESTPLAWEIDPAGELSVLVRLKKDGAIWLIVARDPDAKELFGLVDDGSSRWWSTIKYAEAETMEILDRKPIVVRGDRVEEVAV